MDEEKGIRYSGIELLRILAACAVVVLHYNLGDFSALNTFNNQYWLMNKMVLYFGESLCISAVDLFILISGFFLSKSNKRSIEKPLYLIVQLGIFRCGKYLVTCITNGGGYSLKSFFFCFVPLHYFVILYSVLYFISPYLNKVFVSFSKKDWNMLLFILLLIFSFYQTGIDLFQEVTGKKVVDLNPIGVGGGAQGFNIVNFSLLYIIGAYLRHNEDIVFLNKKWGGLFFFVCVSLVFVWAIFNDKMHRSGVLGTAWSYHNPLVIFSAVSIFSVFKKMKFISRFLNRIARAAFTCFLFHLWLLPFARRNDFVQLHPLILLGHCIATTFCCYVLSILVYEIYNLTIGSIFRKFTFKNITYYSEKNSEATEEKQFT